MLTQARRLARALTGLLAALALVALTTGCSFLGAGTPSVEEAERARDEDRSAQLSSPTIVEDGFLTVGIDASQNAPFVIVGDDGSVSGLDVDVASALADEMGLEVRFVTLDGVDDAKVEDCDVVMGVSTGSAGDLTVVGSYAEHAVTFFQKGETRPASANELTSMTVGLQSASASEQALEATDVVMTQRDFPNLNEAFDALNSGSVDYVLCEAYAGGYLAAQYDDVCVAGTLDAPVAVGVGVAGDNAELQSAVQTSLDALTSNGVLDLLRSRWVGDMLPLTSEDQLSDVGEAAEENPADEAAEGEEQPAA